MESNQDIPECFENFKPQADPDAPLFDDDDDDDDDEEDTGPVVGVASVAQGAAWDAADTSVVFQGDAFRIFSPSTPGIFPFTNLEAATEGTWGS